MERVQAFPQLHTCLTFNAILPLYWRDEKAFYRIYVFIHAYILQPVIVWMFVMIWIAEITLVFVLFWMRKYQCILRLFSLLLYNCKCLPRPSFERKYQTYVNVNVEKLFSARDTMWATGLLILPVQIMVPSNLFLKWSEFLLGTWLIQWLFIYLFITIILLLFHLKDRSALKSTCLSIKSLSFCDFLWIWSSFLL